jgi:hypothetical protein
VKDAFEQKIREFAHEASVETLVVAGTESADGIPEETVSPGAVRGGAGTELTSPHASTRVSSRWPSPVAIEAVSTYGLLHSSRVLSAAANPRTPTTYASRSRARSAITPDYKLLQIESINVSIKEKR